MKKINFILVKLNIDLKKKKLIMQKSKFKLLSRTTLYNLTQDYNHLVILDIRPKEDFLKSFIRQSYWLDNENTNLENLKDFISFLEKKEKNFISSKKKNTKDKNNQRRLVIIKNNSQKQDLPELTKKLDIKNFFTQFSYFENLKEFEKQYPFLTLSPFKTPEDQKNLKNTSFEIIQKKLLKEQQKKVLYANSSFPLCLKKDQIYIGNNFHGNSKILLEDLKIDFLISIKEDDKKKNTFEINENFITIFICKLKIIDFDLILKNLEELVKSKIVMFIGRDSQLSACLVIAYFMKFMKIDVTFASVKVFHVLKNSLCDRIVYNQLMHYKPGEDVIRHV